MSNSLQAINEIGKMDNVQSGSSTSPAHKEYEQGKKLLETKRYGEAAVSLHNALVAFEEKQDENGIANASNQLGHLCLVKGEFEKSLAHYEKVLQICDKLNDRMSILSVLGNKVKALRGLKNFDEAITASLDMLDHHHDNRDPQGSVNSLEVLAEIYLEKGDKLKAADTYRTIGSIHKNFNHDKISESFMKKAQELES